MKHRSQESRLLDWMATGRPITALGALSRFGVLRLAARIERLRKQGNRIRTDTVVRRGKHYASYKLVLDTRNARI